MGRGADHGRSGSQGLSALTLLSLAGLLLSPAFPARAEEEFSLIGWSKACSAAVRHARLPSAADPDVDAAFLRVGALTLAPDRDQVREEWLLEVQGPDAMRPEEPEAVSSRLAHSGYPRPGFVERVRPEPAAPQPGLEQLLRSTASFQVSHAARWPPPESYAIDRAYYSPLKSCALILFRRAAAPRDYRHVLVRVQPDAHRRRARAHATNGLLLYRLSDLEGALAELEIAARMAPDFALARYHHAALLAADGRFEEALGELSAAVRLDRRYAETARSAPEFEELREDRRFKAVAAR